MHVWRRNLWGSAAVLGVTLLISIGLPALNDLVPDGAVAPPGRVLNVSHTVTVQPPPDAVLDSEETSPRAGQLSLEVRGIRLVFQASTYRGGSLGAARRLQRRIVERGYRVGERNRVSTTAAVTGWEARFTSPVREGYFAVFTYHGVLVEVVAQGDGLHLGDRLEAIRGSVRSLRFGGRR